MDEEDIKYAEHQRECESYRAEITKEVEELGQRKEGSARQLFTLLTTSLDKRDNLAVCMAITAAFKALVISNAEEIAAAGSDDDVRREMLSLQGLTRIEFARFLLNMGCASDAHIELNDAGDDIIQLFDADGNGDETAVGLAEELGRMKAAAQRMMASTAPGAETLRWPLSNE